MDAYLPISMTVLLGTMWSGLADAWRVEQRGVTGFDAVEKKTWTSSDGPAQTDKTRYTTVEYDLMSNGQRGAVSREEGGGVVGGVDLEGRKYYQGRYQGSLQYLFQRATLGLRWTASFSRDETTVSYMSLLSQQDAMRQNGIDLAQQKRVTEDLVTQAALQYDCEINPHWKVSAEHSWQQDNSKAGIIGESKRQFDSVVQFSRAQSTYLITRELAFAADAAYGTANSEVDRDIRSMETQLVGELPLPSSLSWLWSVGYTSTSTAQMTKNNTVGHMSIGEYHPNQAYSYRVDVTRSLIRSIAEQQASPTNELNAARNYVSRGREASGYQQTDLSRHEMFLLDEQHAVVTYDFTPRRSTSLRVGRSQIRLLFHNDENNPLIADRVDSQQVAWSVHQGIFGSPNGRLAGGVNLQVAFETLRGDNGSRQQQLSTSVFYDMLF